MRNLKKVLALVLALVMAMSLVTIANAADFSDNADIDYSEAVDVMVAAGIIDGVGNNSFDPKGTLTREQAAKLIPYMLMGENSDKLGVETSRFKDVAVTRWSAPAIEYCVSLGIIDGAGESQHHAGLLVVDPGPQHTRGVHQLNAVLQGKPLLLPGDAGPVFRHSGSAPQHPVDEGGFAHIGDTAGHHPDAAACQALLLVPGQPIRHHLADLWGQLLIAAAVFAVQRQHRQALSLEPLFPLLGFVRVCLVRPVQDDQPFFLPGQGSQVRVAGGCGDPGVQQLADQVDLPDILLHQPLCFGHMAWIPIYLHPTDPILPKGNTRKKALPTIFS